MESAAYIVTFRLEPATTALGSQVKVVVPVPKVERMRRLKAVHAARHQLWDRARELGVSPQIGGRGMVSQVVGVERIPDAAVPPEPGMLGHLPGLEPEAPADLRSEWQRVHVGDPLANTGLRATLWGIGRACGPVDRRSLSLALHSQVVELIRCGLAEVDDGDFVRLTPEGRRELVRA